MADIFGLDSQTAMLLAAAALFGLWWIARSPKITHGSTVLMSVFCMRCNWQGRVQRGSAKCAKCGASQHSLSVLSV